MPTMQIGLGARSRTIGRAELAAVAAALDIQMLRDVGPVWEVAARVTLLDDPDNVPTGISPIIVVDTMPGTMKGVHAAQNGVAFAMILATEGWSLSASHECIEMAVDPSGEATRPGRGLAVVGTTVQDTANIVDYILEASDPVEDERFGYKIGDVLVSDFYTPRYFDDAVAVDVKYSHNGGVARPREVAPNGYLSWRERGTNMLRQLRRFGVPEIVTLGAAPGPAVLQADGDHVPTLRCHVDGQTDTPRIRRMRERRLQTVFTEPVAAKHA